MKTYMMTIPRTVPRRALMIMIEVNDCKKWIIGKEKGKNGYEHWQIRIETSNDDFFKWVKAHIPTAHIEEAQQELMNVYTKPRKDNTYRIQTELELFK